MPYSIRTGHLSDVESCVDILRAWAAETPWMEGLNERPELIDGWSEFFTSELVWVAEVENRIVGFCTRGDDNIGALYVKAEFRRCGIGKGLLDCAKKDRDWITVWAYEKNTEALTFYRREDLIEISRELEESSGLMNIEHRWTRAA